jgi:hypothetical protein
MFHQWTFYRREVKLANVGSPLLGVTVACENDDSWLPGDKSTFNRHFNRVAISESLELRCRRDRTSFNIIKQDNIVVAIIEPLSIVVWGSDPVTT